MSKSKENVKIGSYVYYSRLLEKSDDFLCVYKKTHHLIGMNAEVWTLIVWQLSFARPIFVKTTFLNERECLYTGA